MNNQPLIKQITLRNFLSYGDRSESIELLPLNVLIGPNGAGKSNLLEAIGVLRAAMKDFAGPFRNTGVSEWIWKDPDKKFKSESMRIEAILTQPGVDMGLRYCVEISETAGRTELLNESLENETASNDETEPYSYYRNHRGHMTFKVINRGDESMPLSERESRTTDPANEKYMQGYSLLSLNNDPAFYPEVSYVSKQFSSISIYRLWDTGQSSPLRTPSNADDPKTYLLDDASNLALVLNNILMHGAVKNKVLMRLKSFYDRAEDIFFDIYANKVQLVIRESGDVNIPASRLSDGTLRFLALLALIYNPAPPSIICIEEPELGMHPDIIPIIAEMLVEASKNTQLIITTHSDLLVSKLKEMPETILVCDWTDSGTTIRRLTEADVKEWDDDISLGDIWLKGGFGGTRW